MVWTLDNDDFRGKCYGEQSPLISTLKSALQEGESLLTTKATRAPKVTSRTTSKPKTTQRPKSSTPPPFTTPEPSPPFECADEGFFNNPTDCKKYFWCLDSGPSNLGLVAHSFTCPSGLFFNKARDSCDYAANVVCRVKKPSTTTSTTPKPRPRPRQKTTKTTRRTTPKPKEVVLNDLDLDALKAPLEAVKSESLSDLLQLLQQLGLNQIQDKLHGRESSSNAANTTLSPTLPEYRTLNRRRPSTTTTDSTPSAEVFNQYARPDRTTHSGDGASRTVIPRGPQFHAPAPEAGEVNHDDLFPDVGDDVDEDPRQTFPPGDFPFVYHTPSRQRSRTTADDSVEEEEDDKSDDVTTTPKPARPTQSHRRVVVRVRPMTPKGQDAKEKLETPRNQYILAQTVGVRQQVQPNRLEELTTPPSSKPPRRARPIRKTTTTTTTTTTTEPPRYRAPPRPKELVSTTPFNLLQ